MGIRRHSPGPFKKNDRIIYDANGVMVGNCFVLKLGDEQGRRLAEANADLFEQAPNLLDMVESYLDRMVSLGETNTIPFLAAKQTYEAASKTEYKF